MTHMDISARSARIVALACTALCGVAHAIERPEPQPPEVDTIVEVIAVAVGGRTVVTQIVDRGAMFATPKSKAAMLKGDSRGVGSQKLPVCSRAVRSPDDRAECENFARLQLQKASAVKLTSQSYEALSRASKFYFERRNDREGIVNAYANGRSLRVRISTRDELLARVRVLGMNAKGNAVVMAESMSQLNGVLRWRSNVSSYDERGQVTETAQLDGSNASALPYGDYAVVNDKGELGVLRMSGNSISVDWRQLTPVGKADAGAALLPPLAEAQTADFDFERFAQISSTLDGDEGRASDRPITRAQVLENIKKYMDARWTLSQLNYEAPGVPSECRPPENRTWLRPHTLEGSVGKPITALPYKWGGYISVERFMSRIAGPQLAGSVCTCTDPARNYCVVDQAVGIDCSGFLSRVWNVDRHTTASLDSISTPVTWRELKPGDAVNKPRSHVRVFLERMNGADIGFRIAESSVSCGGVCERVLSARELDGYRPIRYRQIRD
jgi:hypothetical protein